MNLNDFEKTSYNGLYISKENHPEKGRKFIARFQYNKKRYVKVLGFSKVDGLTRKGAYDLLEEYKNSIIKQVETSENNVTVEDKKIENLENVNEELNSEFEKLKQENEQSHLKLLILLFSYFYLNILHNILYYIKKDKNTLLNEIFL